jgi:ribosomal-protein-alanine N-acetyltransferase
VSPVGVAPAEEQGCGAETALAESRRQCFNSVGHGGCGLIVIRNAHQQEAEVLAAIGLRAWRQATMALGITTPLYDNAASAFSNFTRSSWLAIRVAEFGGTVAGWAAREHFNEAISDFWIDPDFQRRGIGSLLLADIERQILQRDFETIRLETHAQNEPAVAFFRHHGYSVRWLSVSYAPKLDRDVQSVGLQKQLVEVESGLYGPEF